jgi:hypothetical protein
MSVLMKIKRDAINSLTLLWCWRHYVKRERKKATMELEDGVRKHATNELKDGFWKRAIM